MGAVVECYAGTGYPERPRVFLWEGERLEVAVVEHRHRTPAGVRFRVRTSDSRCFSLFYYEAGDAWEVRACASASGGGRA